jgi:hypothetical protein
MQLQGHRCEVQRDETPCTNDERRIFTRMNQRHITLHDSQKMRQTTTRCIMSDSETMQDKWNTYGENGELVPSARLA